MAHDVGKVLVAGGLGDLEMEAEVRRHGVAGLRYVGLEVVERLAHGLQLLLGTAGVDPTTRERVARVPVDTPLPVGEMVRTRAPTFVESSPVWRAAHPDVPVMPGDDVRAWAALPLRVEDGTEERLLGALAITFAGPRTFADEEVDFLQAYADL